MKKITIFLMLITVFSINAFSQFDSVLFQKELAKITSKKVDYSLYQDLTKIASGYERKRTALTHTKAELQDMWRINTAYALANFEYSQEQEALVRELPKYIDRLTEPGFEIPDNYYDRVKAAFANDGPLYRLTFETPGNAVPHDGKTCSPSPDSKAPGEELMPNHPDCECNWDLGCDSDNCGQPTVPCTPVLNCGIIWSTPCRYQCRWN